MIEHDDESDESAETRDPIEFLHREKIYVEMIIGNLISANPARLIQGFL
jgi:hypothetical protein